MTKKNDMSRERMKPRGLRANDTLWAKVEEMAKKNNVTSSETARWIIEKFFKKSNKNIDAE